MNVFVTAASLRTGSLNLRLARLVVEKLRAEGHDVELVPFAELVTPPYDEDLRATTEPEGAARLKSLLETKDAAVFVCPEYNFSIPGHLKNTIDWVSRYRPIPFRGVPTLLAAASPGMVGGVRGLWAARIPLEGLGAHVYPDMMTLALAADAWNEMGGLKDAALDERLESMLAGFTDYAKRLRD